MCCQCWHNTHTCIPIIVRGHHSQYVATSECEVLLILFLITMLAFNNYKTKIIEIKQLLLQIQRTHFLFRPSRSQSGCSLFYFSSLWSWEPSFVENRSNQSLLGFWCMFLHVITVPVLGVANKGEQAAFQQFFLASYIPNKNDHILSLPLS